jgi:outer membrane protein TolC
MVCLAAIGSTPHASDDPYKTDALVPPNHHSVWKPSEAVIVSAPASEAMPASSKIMTLAQLTDIALRNNPRTRQAWAAAQVEAAQYGISKSASAPKVDLLLNLSRARVVSNTSGIATHEQNRYGPSASLSYVLFDFGARDADLQAQGYRVLAANLTQNRVMQEVVFQVEQAYFRLLGVEQLVRTANLALKSTEATLDAARRRHQAGLATIGDVFRSETAVAQATLNLRRIEGEVAKARGLLASACGLPITTQLSLEPWGDQQPGVQMKDKLETLLRQASQSRPDMAAAESRVKAARAAVKAAEAGGLPSLELNLQSNRTLYTDGRRHADGNLIAFNLRVPVFDGWRDEYTVRRAQAQVSQAEAARDQLFNQTELDVWQAYYDLQTATTGIATTKTLVQGATQTASVAAARYQSGVGNLLDLLTAQTDETNALVQSIQSQLDWYTALARLNFALGASGHFGVTP